MAYGTSAKYLVQFQECATERRSVLTLSLLWSGVELELRPKLPADSRTSVRSIFSGTLSLVGGRVLICSAGSADDGPDDYSGDRGVDGVVEVLGVLVDEPVLGAKQRSESDEEGVPNAAAGDGEDGECGEVHLLRTGGEGDDASDAGKESAEEDGTAPVFGEPVRGFLEVRLIDQGQFGQPADGAFQAELGSQPVQEQCSEVGAEGAGDYHEHDVHVSLLGGESGQRQDDLAGDGWEYGFGEGEQSDPPFPERVDGAGGDPDDAADITIWWGCGRQCHC